MAFIIVFFFLKTFEKVEKTGIISTKFSLRCTPSVILGVTYKVFHLVIDIHTLKSKTGQDISIYLGEIKDGIVQII